MKNYVVEYLSWLPPGIVDAADFPEGAWVIGHEPGQVSAILAPGPSYAGSDWLALHHCCPTSALTRVPDVDLGIYATRAGRLDYDRVDHWISVPVWSVTTAKP